MQSLNNFKNQIGFSLLELIIAMVILIILTLLSFPAYHNAILAGRRAEARSALHSVLLQQEIYYTLHNTYYLFDENTSNSPFKWWSGDSVSTSYYKIEATLCRNIALTKCVLLTASPISGSESSNPDPICGNLMIDSSNNKSYSASAEPNSTCW